MILMQIALAGIYMIAIPYLTGCLLAPGYGKTGGGKCKADEPVACGEQEDEKHCSTTWNRAWTFASGLMVQYALYEILALIYIKLSGSFRQLSILYGIVSAVLAAAGAMRTGMQMRCDGKKAHVRKSVQRKNARPDLFFLAGLLLIAVQIIAILYMATPDKDDAFYSGLSSLCFSQDRVLMTDAYDGLQKGSISKRYVLSALPAYQATLSFLSDGLHHLFITHNLFPLFYMPLAYALLYGIGKELLESEGIRRAEGKLLFCLALLHMIGNYFVFSPENFLVTRMWQGKALFVALGVPCLWYFAHHAMEGMADGKKSVREWFLVATVMLAVSFMGETGLFLGPFLLACLCLAYLVNCRLLRQFIPAVACCLPEAVLVLVFLL